MEDPNDYWDGFQQGAWTAFVFTTVFITLGGIAGSVLLEGDYSALMGVAAGFVVATFILWASTD
jgi:hypothetical protein